MKRIMLFISLSVLFSLPLSAQSREDIVAQINRHLLNSYKYNHESLVLENGTTLIHTFGNGTRHVEVEDLLSFGIEKKSDCWQAQIKCNPDSMIADWGTYSDFNFDILDKDDCEAVVRLFRQLAETPRTRSGGGGANAPG